MYIGITNLYIRCASIWICLGIFLKSGGCVGVVSPNEDLIEGFSGRNLEANAFVQSSLLKGEVGWRFFFWRMDGSGQIITTSAEVTLNGGFNKGTSPKWP